MKRDVRKLVSSRECWTWPGVSSSPPPTLKKKTIHNLPKTSPHQKFHHKCVVPGIDPIDRSHSRIQYSGPLWKDPHPEPVSDRALTSSRTRISSPPVNVPHLIGCHRTGTTTVTWPTQKVTYVIPGWLIGVFIGTQTFSVPTSSC